MNKKIKLALARKTARAAARTAYLDAFTKAVVAARAKHRANCDAFAKAIAAERAEGTAHCGAGVADDPAYARPIADDAAARNANDDDEAARVANDEANNAYATQRADAEIADTEEDYEQKEAEAYVEAGVTADDDDDDDDDDSEYETHA